MDISGFDIIVKRHVFDQALVRNIHPDMIEDAIFKGKHQRFGKNGLRIISEGTKRTIIVIAEIEGNDLKILTIEEGN